MTADDLALAVVCITVCALGTATGIATVATVAWISRAVGEERRARRQARLIAADAAERCGQAVLAAGRADAEWQAARRQDGVR